MKFVFRNIIFIAILSFVSTVVSGQVTRQSYYDSTATMPPFRFYLPDGTLFTPGNLNKDHKTVMIYFKNECPYCEDQAEIISKNIIDFNAVDFIFITKEDTSAIRSFSARYKLENNDRVKFLQDKERLYYRYYIAHSTPSIHIYDNNKRLIIFKEGVLGREELLKYIQNIPQ